MNLYSIEFLEEAKADLKSFDRSQQIFVLKQLKKIEKSPELGKLLGNKNGYNLSGYRKMYADNKKIRIVYKIVEDRIIVEVVAVGNRSEMEVYQKASERI
jgi:mRNA interferase RelE/StbE